MEPNQHPAPAAHSPARSNDPRNTSSDDESPKQGRVSEMTGTAKSSGRSTAQSPRKRPAMIRNPSGMLTRADVEPQSDLIGRPRWTRKWPAALPTDTELSENDVEEHLAESWKTSWKWFTLAILAVVQVSMNFNASVYGNAVAGMRQSFGVSIGKALIGQWIFLILYAFGCELWAPWSEDYGRASVLQASLWAVNITQILGAVAKNMDTVLVGRALGGLCSAGGSITLGVVSDLYKPADTQKPVAFVVFFSVLGSVIGPVIGAVMEEYVDSWRWIFWLQLILGVVAAGVHLLAPETRSTILTKRYAQDLRVKDIRYASTEELRGSKLTFRKCCATWWRPFKMFLTEPVVLCLSLLSGFSDALIFMFLEAYGEIYGTVWKFGTIGKGLAFLPLAVGYLIGWWAHVVDVDRQNRKIADLARENKTPRIEEKLRLLMWLAPLEFFGLLMFALFCNQDWHIHWIAPMIASGMVGVANYSIYFATVDYMVTAYGPYAASATGGNGFARDLLAGISALYAMPLYRNVGQHPLVSGSAILAGICLLVLAPIYVFFLYGGWFRSHSGFMKKVQDEREKFEEGVRVRAAAEGTEVNDLRGMSEATAVGEEVPKIESV